MEMETEQPRDLLCCYMLLSAAGFLGSVTKTASADGCPGKCIHALASLMCDSVLENIQCPASNMR